MNATVARATRRTLGAMCLTLLVMTVMPMLAGRAHNPFLTFSTLLGTLMLLYRIWAVTISDAQITAFHFLVNFVNLVKQFKQEFISYDPNMPPDDKRKGNRKLLRVAVLFVMAQKSFIPQHSLSWLHSLLAYKFLIDLSVYLKKLLRQRHRDRRRHAQEAVVAQQNAAAEGNDNVIGDAEGRAEAQDINVELISDDQPSRRSRLPKMWLLAIQIFKGLFFCSVLYHQFFYASALYVLSTLTYFLLNQNTLHSPVTVTLESLQWDYFEGLEHYYVTGFLGVLEISFSITFMIICLLESHQFLMLVALYTNVYTCSRELINNSVTSAFAEWTILAHFKKATNKELRDLDDVCAICLSDMWSARKTPCQHFFHGRCLRKCLRERASCPMCFKNFDFF